MGVGEMRLEFEKKKGSDVTLGGSADPTKGACCLGWRIPLDGRHRELEKKFSEVTYMWSDNPADLA